MAKNILPITVQIRSTPEWKAWLLGQANRKGTSIPDVIDEALGLWAKREKVEPPPSRVTHHD